MPDFVAKITFAMRPVDAQSAVYEALSPLKKQAIMTQWKLQFAQLVPLSKQDPWGFGRLFVDQASRESLAGDLSSEVVAEVESNATGGEQASLSPIPNDEGGIWHPCTPRPCHFGNYLLNKQTGGGPAPWEFTVDLYGFDWRGEATSKYTLHEWPRA